MRIKNTVSHASLGESAIFCRILADNLGWHWLPIGPENQFGAIYNCKWHLLRNLHITQKMYWGWNESENQILAQYLNSLQQFQHNWRYRRIVWRFRYDEAQNLKQVLAHFGRCNCQLETLHSHVIDIKDDDFEYYLRHRISKRKMQYIRQGKRSGLVYKNILNDEHLSQFYNLHLLWARQKHLKANSKEFFQQIRLQLAARSTLAGVFLDDTLLAGVQIWKDKNIWDATNLVRTDAEKLPANDFLFGRMIKTAFEHGVQAFDLGGSAGIDSIEYFKERWDAQKRPFWILTWENPFWKNFANIIGKKASG